MPGPKPLSVTLSENTMPFWSTSAAARRVRHGSCAGGEDDFNRR